MRLSGRWLGLGVLPLIPQKGLMLVLWNEISQEWVLIKKGHSIYLLPLLFPFPLLCHIVMHPRMWYTTGWTDGATQFWTLSLLKHELNKLFSLELPSFSNFVIATGNRLMQVVMCFFVLLKKILENNENKFKLEQKNWARDMA